MSAKSCRIIKPVWGLKGKYQLMLLPSNLHHAKPQADVFGVPVTQKNRVLDPQQSSNIRSYSRSDLSIHWCGSLDALLMSDRPWQRLIFNTIRLLPSKGPLRHSRYPSWTSAVYSGHYARVVWSWQVYRSETNTSATAFSSNPRIQSMRVAAIRSSIRSFHTTYWSMCEQSLRQPLHKAVKDDCILLKWKFPLTIDIHAPASNLEFKAICDMVLVSFM